MGRIGLSAHYGGDCGEAEQMSASDYYGITAAIKDGAQDYAAAQRKLVEMVDSGAATWWPGRELIAVNRGEQGQLNLGAKSNDKK